MNPKILLVGTTLAIVAAALAVVFVVLGRKSGDFYLSAKNPEGGFLYLKVKGQAITYDYTSAIKDTTAFTLDRYTSSNELGSSLITTIIQNGAVVKVAGATKAAPWKARVTKALTGDIAVSADKSLISVTIGGEVKTIVLVDGKPVTFADMPVVDFSFDVAAWDTRATASVPNPTESEVQPVGDDEVVTRRMEENGRHLAENVFPEGNRFCALRFAQAAYNFNKDLSNPKFQELKNQVASGNMAQCNGPLGVNLPSETIVGFQGTKDMMDVVDDILGLADNFASGYNRVDWETGGPQASAVGNTGPDGNFVDISWIKSTADINTKYDWCVGHSLGGAIAKYSKTAKGKCEKVVTFGAPYTVGEFASDKIVQFIRSKSHDGCCERSWWGGCDVRGSYFADPITLVGTIGGKHVNPVYVGGFGHCREGIVSTLWHTVGSLHSTNFPSPYPYKS